MGEGHHGEVRDGSAPRGGDGIYTDGPSKGLLQHGMFMVENTWGVYQQNQRMQTGITLPQATSYLKSAKDRNVPLSFNLVMWDDGSVLEQSLQLMRAICNAGKVGDSLAKGKPATASGEWSPGFAASKAFDGDPQTRWSEKSGSRMGWLEVDLGKDTLVGQATIMEIGNARIVEEFAVEYKKGDVWIPVQSGTTIGSWKILDFKPITGRYFRLNIRKASEVPTIQEFQLHAPVGTKSE